MNTNGGKPKVSVCVVTYNQEKYIRQCLQSVIDQEVDFKFEIIVGDDCSTDRTRAIIDEFVERYPGQVIALYHEKNHGAVWNYFSTHDCAQGEYIAHLDGDDYFLPGKLKIQANFLDENKEVNVVWHRVFYEFSDGGLVEDLVDYNKIQRGFSREDLIRFTFLANHSTKMYRASQRKFCTRVENTLDYFLNIEHLQDGKAAYVGSEVLGVYRYGMGVSTYPNLKFRTYLIDGLEGFIRKGLFDKESVNGALFSILVVDLKHRYPTLFRTLRLWLITLSISSVVGYKKFFSLRKMYALPRR